jgi:hypothetical protein
MKIKLDKTLILNRVKEKKNFSTNTELALFLGISLTTLSNWYARNSIDFDILFTKCESMDANWLLSGRSEILEKPSENSPESFPDVSFYKEMIKEKDVEIKELNREVGASNNDNKRKDVEIMELNKRNWELETEVKNLKKQIEDSASARKRQVETIEIDIDNKQKANVG